MAQGFKSTPRGYTARFTPEEVQVLTQLFEDVALTLEPDEDAATDPLADLVGISENAQIPTDPALARMLPVASDDPEIADEFRRFTEFSLRRGKIANLHMAAMDARSVDLALDAAHARAWATALNDVRLTLATRLELKTEKDAARISQMTEWKDVETTDQYMALLYNFITWLQDSLMEAMLSQLDD